MTTELSPMTPGLHRFYMMDRIVHGRAAAEALQVEVARLEKSNVFLVTNKSLAGGSRVAAIVRELGDRYAGQFAGVTAHGPRQSVIDGANAARTANADLLVAVGGGSVIDAAKVMQLCLRNSVRDAGTLSDFVVRDRGDPSTRPADADRWIRMIAIPTTLSAAEFTWFGGAFNPESGMKEAFSNAMMIPQVIIMDPQMTMETPMHLLLTTGMKAVDHAAERLASLKSNPYNDAVSSLALRLLSSGLRLLIAIPQTASSIATSIWGVHVDVRGCGGCPGRYWSRHRPCPWSALRGAARRDILRDAAGRHAMEPALQSGPSVDGRRLPRPSSRQRVRRRGRPGCRTRPAENAARCRRFPN